MITTFNMPVYAANTYLKNNHNSYYAKQGAEAGIPTINRLPNELRIAPAKAVRIATNVTELILSKEKTGNKYSFFTGLHPTYFINWFVGNDVEEIGQLKVRSLVLFHFSNDRQEMKVYYFHRYDKESAALRIAFANSVIPHLLQIPTV